MVDTYDPSDEFTDDRDEGGEDLSDFGGGVDDSPETNEQGEIISQGDGEVRDFAMQDDRDDVGDDEDGGFGETRETTLDQQGLSGGNAFEDDDGDDGGETVEAEVTVSSCQTKYIIHEDADRELTADAVARVRDRVYESCGQPATYGGGTTVAHVVVEREVRERTEDMTATSEWHVYDRDEFADDDEPNLMVRDELVEFSDAECSFETLTDAVDVEVPGTLAGFRLDKETSDLSLSDFEANYWANLNENARHPRDAVQYSVYTHHIKDEIRVETSKTVYDVYGLTVPTSTNLLTRREVRNVEDRDDDDVADELKEKVGEVLDRVYDKMAEDNEAANEPPEEVPTKANVPDEIGSWEFVEVQRRSDAPDRTPEDVREGLGFAVTTVWRNGDEYLFLSRTFSRSKSRKVQPVYLSSDDDRTDVFNDAVVLRSAYDAAWNFMRTYDTGEDPDTDFETVDGIGSAKARKIALLGVESVDRLAKFAERWREGDESDDIARPTANVKYPSDRSKEIKKYLSSTAMDDLLDDSDDAPEGTVQVAEDVGDVDADIYEQDTSNPSNIPEDERQKEINFADEILDAALTKQELGHHNAVTRSIQSWAPRDGREDYYRPAAFALTADEANLGGSIKDTDFRLVDDYEPYKKARTVIAWASDTDYFDADELRELEKETQTVEDAFDDGDDDVEPYDPTEEFVDSRDDDEVGSFNDFDEEGSDIDEEVPEGYEGDRVIRGTERWLNPTRNTVFLVREKFGDKGISAKEMTRGDQEATDATELIDDRSSRTVESVWGDGESKYSRDAMTIEFNDLDALEDAWEPVYAPSVGVTEEQTELLRQSDNVVVEDDDTEPYAEFSDDEIKDKVETALSWAEDPPNEYGGWTKLNDDLMHNSVEAAYAGAPNGTYSVAMVYEFETSSPRGGTNLSGGIYSATQFDGMATPPMELSPKQDISPTDSPLVDKSTRTRIFDALRLALERNPSEDVDTGEVTDRMAGSYTPSTADVDHDSLTDTGLGDFGGADDSENNEYERGAIEEARQEDDENDYTELEDFPTTPNGWAIGKSPSSDRLSISNDELKEYNWAVRWYCRDTKEAVVARTNDEGTHEVELYRLPDTKNLKQRTLGTGIPSRKMAVEVAIAHMGENKCRTTEDAAELIRADELDVDTGSGALLQYRDFESYDESSREDVKETTERQKQDMAEDFESTVKPYDPTTEFEDVVGGDEPDDEETRKEVTKPEEADEDNDETDEVEVSMPEDPLTISLTKEGMKLLSESLALSRRNWGEIKDYMSWEDFERDDIKRVIKKIPRSGDNATVEEGSMYLSKKEFDVAYAALVQYEDEFDRNRTRSDVEDTFVRELERWERDDPDALLDAPDVQDEIGLFKKQRQNEAEIRYERVTDDEKAKVSAEKSDSLGTFRVSSSRFDISGEDSELITTNSVMREDFGGNSLEYETLAHRAAAEAEHECDRLELERRAPEGWSVGKFEPRKPEVRFDDGCFTTGRHADDADEKRYCRFVRATSDGVWKGARNKSTGEVHTENDTGRQPDDPISAAVEVMQNTGVGDIFEKVEIEFGGIEEARDFRDTFGEYLHPDDNYRKKTVTVTEDLPDDVEEAARSEAVQTRAERGGTHGQEELTDDEKDEIDFSETSIFHAQTAKAIAHDKGVNTWLDFYDPTLTTDEHVEAYERARHDSGRRMDADELDDDTVEEKLAEMEVKSEMQECGHAKDKCAEGYEEACEFLTDECGVDESFVDELLEEEDFEEIEDVDAETFDAPELGDIESAELPQSVRIAFGKAWNGYRAGRADIDEGVECAEKFAAIINSIRQGIGQEPMSFDAKGGFEGGEITPDDREDVDEFETEGRVKEGRVTLYDPTEEL